MFVSVVVVNISVCGHVFLRHPQCFYVWSLSKLFVEVYYVHVVIVSILIASSVSIVPVPGVIFPLVVVIAIVTLLVDFSVPRHRCCGEVCFGSLVVFLLLRIG